MGRQAKVLIMEDDPYICDLICLYAEKSGYTVSVSNDGIHGLEMLATRLLELSHLIQGNMK